MIQIGTLKKHDIGTRCFSSRMNDASSDAPEIKVEIYDLLAEMRTKESSEKQLTHTLLNSFC